MSVQSISVTVITEDKINENKLVVFGECIYVSLELESVFELRGDVSEYKRLFINE